MMADAWTMFNLPSSWALAPLRDLCNVVRGGSPRPMGDPRFFVGSIPFIKISDVTASDGVHVCQSTTNVNEEGAKRSRLLKKGDLILSNSGTVCVPAFLGMDACIHDGFVTFERLTASIDQKYLYHFFNYIRPYIIDKHRQGVTQVNLNTTIVGDIVLIVPPSNEQRRIVAKIEELFSELDAGIASLTTAREQLKAYRQALLNAAFQGRLTKDWRHDNSGRIESADDTLARLNRERQEYYNEAVSGWNSAVKAWETNGTAGSIPVKPLAAPPINTLSPSEAAELPALPHGWVWVRLSSVCEVSGGLTKNQHKRQTLPRRMKYLRVANVHADRLDLSAVHEIPVTDDEAAKVTLQTGDLLVVEGNGSVDQIGRVAMWSGEVPECGHQNHLIRARVQIDCSPRYLLQFLLSPVGRDLIIKQASSTTGLHTLSISKVSNLPVPITSTLEQAALLATVDQKLSAVDAVADEIATQLARAEALRRSILRRAFRGQLLPQDASDEPATLLLDRLRADRAATMQAVKRPIATKKRNSAA